jgi:hypothetical protein
VKKVDIFRYTDARVYVRYCQKSNLPPWPISYGVLANLIGVSKGFLWSALQGKKMFSREIADRLPMISQLNKNETFYLRLMLLLSSVDMDNGLRIAILNKFRPVKYKWF